MNKKLKDDAAHIFSLIGDPQYNAMRLSLTTTTLVSSCLVEDNEDRSWCIEKGNPNHAELGRHTQRDG